jgi:very-short-patch-repair endonuclease
MGPELHKGAPPKLFYYSRNNRKQSTKAEEILWMNLRNRKLHRYKFRRQHPISDFIADFYCHECKLVVEVDGEYHTDIEQKQYDEGRTYEINGLKIKVVRFTNREVLEDIDFVLDEIGAHLFACSNEKNK